MKHLYKKGRPFFMALSLSMLLFCFQNCSQNGFQVQSVDLSSQQDLGADIPDDMTPAPGPTPTPPVSVPPTTTPPTTTPPISGTKAYQYNSALVGVEALPAITGCAAKSGVCYYVKPVASGGAGSTCSQASPCNAVTGIKKLAAGDTLYFMAGQYAAYEGSSDYLEINRYVKVPSTASAPVTIRGYPGAIMKGNGNTNCGIIDGNSYLIVSGLTFDGCRESGILVGYDAGNTTTNLIISNNEFKNISNSDNMGAILITGASDIQFINNKVHDFTHRTYGLSQGGGMVIFRGKNITIQNNEFFRLGAALYYKHGEASPGAGGYTRIYGNYIHDSYNGLFASNQNRTDIKYNIFDGSNTTASKPLDFYNEDGTCAANNASADCTFVTDVVIEYNTFINSNLNQGWILGDRLNWAGPRKFSVARNIFYNSYYNIWQYGPNSYYLSLKPSELLVSDYNCFYSNNGSLEFMYFVSRGGWKKDFNGWKAEGFDKNSVNVDPGLNLTTYQVSNAACSGYGAFFK